MEIGKKIKRLRIEKQLTQEELANRCELSKGFISQLENDLTSPSIATLIDILEILGTNLKEFFNDTESEKIVFVNLKEFFNDTESEKIVFVKDDMFETEDEELKYEFKWLVPNSQKNEMEPVIVTIQPGGQYKEEKPHEGEEFGYVLAGSVFLHLGEKKLKVRKGESFYFKPRAKHFLSNEGKTVAKVLWVSTPPTLNLELNTSYQMKVRQ